MSGILLFIDTNVLIINEHPSPLREKLFLELNLSFPNLKIIEVTAEAGDKHGDKRFPSALVVLILIQ